ncbi:MAG: hypothetical protein ACOCWQ_05950 [Nanoarchaeota archaeon]
MKIFIACSKHFYSQIPPIREALEDAGHSITLPNSYDRPFREEEMKKRGPHAHAEWKSAMMREHEPNISKNDAILVLNLEKYGKKNYIGGATFMEIVTAWQMNKHIYFYNPLPDCIFTDELTAMRPTVLHGDLAMIPHTV